MGLVVVIILILTLVGLLLWEHATFMKQYAKEREQELDRQLELYKEENAYLYRDHLTDSYNFQIGLESMAK